jgi:siroheme synthase (precorrin-2 oxidase/ferrochelatase)
MMLIATLSETYKTGVPDNADYVVVPTTTREVCTALVTAAEEKETAIDDTNLVNEIHKIQNASSLCCIYLLSSSALVVADAIDILCTSFFMF